MNLGDTVKTEQRLSYGYGYSLHAPIMEIGTQPSTSPNQLLRGSQEGRHLAHNQVTMGSNPVPATNLNMGQLLSNPTCSSNGRTPDLESGCYGFKSHAHRKVDKGYLTY